MSKCQICGKWGEHCRLTEYAINAGFGCFYYDWLCNPCAMWIDDCLHELYRRGKIALSL